jgi:integrase
MAAYRRLPSGLWQVQVFRRGIRRSSSFPSKGLAIAWAGQQESEIMAGVRGEIPNLTVLDLLTRYADKVSKGKKGEKWELIRLEAMGRDRLAQVRLRVLDSPHASDWQERRLQAIKPASVRRERNLLNNVFEIARKEWRWIKRNPFEGVRRPKDGKPRDRVASQAEQDKLIAEASPALARAIVVALETAMRCKEIASNPPIVGNVAKVGDSKTGVGREVPLSAKAKTALQGGIGLTAGSISAMFADLCKRVDPPIKGLTFHDLRRTAIVRLSKKLGAFELAKMVGHTDLKMTLNVYYKADPEATAKKL